MSTQQSPESEQSRLQKTPIAIIGISSIFPNSKNINQYWSNIISEVDCITDVPASRWNIADYYDPDPKVPDKTYSKRGAFIPDIEFNPLEFGLPPNLLELTEVSQLLTLVLTRDLLKNGGYEKASAELRKMTGVILGVGGAQKLMTPLMSRLQYPIWKRVLDSVSITGDAAELIINRLSKAYVKWEENSFPGALGNITSGRIANRFDLSGTNCVVDAACASSLAGIRMAVHELLDYRSDMMITGGVDMDNSVYAYLCFSKTPAFSRGEKSQPFDKDSAGMLIGEGIGLLLLKRLEDAERDQDRIYAVIKGIGTSSDGRSKSIYAPNSEGQIIALERAYQDAGFSPATVGMIEAHGTGTAAGDIAEVNALKMLFEKYNTPKDQVALGSVKSQIGHTKNAAGVAGLIKGALSLYHKILPATINVKEPNPKLDLDSSALYLNSEVRPWIPSQPGIPRRAGISAFGFGGTNFHLALEEYQPENETVYRLHQSSDQILLQAENTTALLQNCQQIVKRLTTDDSSFQQLATDSQDCELPIKNARLGFAVKDKQQCIDKLNAGIKKLEQDLLADNWELPNGVFFRSTGLALEGKLVALFAGQGSPYVNMGKELACNFPPVRECFTIVNQHLLETGQNPVSKVVYPKPVFTKAEKDIQAKELQLTENAQPAIGAFSAGQYKILNQAGFNPNYTAGHSFGELTALWASGVFNESEYLMLAKARGEAMAAPADPGFDAGSMLAVIGDLENLKKDIAGFKNIVMANINSHQQIVLAGPKDEIGRVKDHLNQLSYRAILLPVSAAFHTPLVAHAQKPFASALDQVKFKKPKIAVYSNGTAKKHSVQTQSIKKKLKEHILEPVNFKDEITNIYKDGGYLFVEFGPQNILCKLVSNILKDQPHISVAINKSAGEDSDYLLKEAVVKMRVAGVKLGDIDPYREPESKQEIGKNAMSVMLNGSNYISDKTKQEFESALAEKHSFIEQEVQKQIKVIQQSQPKIQANTQTTMSTQSDQAKLSSRFKNQPAQANVDRSMEHFYQHQNETLKVHNQFLKQQSEYSKSFMQIMLQQTQSTNPNAFSVDVVNSINQFHKHQSDTLRVHENYLNQQVSHSKESFQFIKQLSGQAVPYSEPVAIKTVSPVQYVESANPVVEDQKPIEPVVSRDTVQVVNKIDPIPVTTMPETSVAQPDGDIKEKVLKIVSDKTGYLPDMLDLSMNIEADLGIDSIKRVEIVNSIQDEFPATNQMTPEEISGIETLGQIVEFLSGGTSKTSPAPETVSAPSQPIPLVGIKVEPESGTQAVKDLLLQVVSEKTGYLVEMLELDMDLEADLGIDSIKRVEILNEIKEKVSGLPEINNDQLSEKRTLRAICQFLENASGAETKTNQVQETPLPQKSSFSKATIQQVLIEVISEKTGYVEEMLELDMDLEADLGIDSIKRVEILNGIQEKITDLPGVNTDDLSELRTLQQIVDFLVSNSGQISVIAEDKQPLQQDVQNGLSDTEISSALLDVVGEKTGYPPDMLDMNMDLEADLGIDSIKRVEIINALQEVFPSLGVINPDELTEIRTLQQIIDHIKKIKKKIPN
ncbi:MAG: acyltransferase domain-containing protein [Deltaproteobacteria bacterium]|jgi:acyl carrier protein|nr:acyltransferase domain-containing protein [Deltaproteobacteria bacterium]